MSRLAPFMVAVLTAFSAAQSPDTVILKTGARLEGTIIGESEERITLSIPGGSMELRRSQIQDIYRQAPVAEAVQQKVHLSLSRFADSEQHFFLYRDGHRVGYRILGLARAAREDIPVYVHSDRLVFLKAPGGTPELDVVSKEFVDAELKPVAFETSIASGQQSRRLEGKVENSNLKFTERVGGSDKHRNTFFRQATGFAGFLSRRLAQEPTYGGEVTEERIFVPREQAFQLLNVERRRDRVVIRGHEKEVVVLRSGRGASAIETWVDAGGLVVREELGTNRLVAQIAPADEVLAYARGDAVYGNESLDLEVVSEEAGLRFLRPDQTWNLIPGAKARRTLASLVHPHTRATIDVFRLEEGTADATEEGVALKVLARLREEAEQVVVEGPVPGLVGDRPGLRFSMTCRRRDTDLRTLGAICVAEGQALVILAAAPKAGFDAALPGFQEVFSSLRFLGHIRPKTALDPFEVATTEVGR